MKDYKISLAGDLGSGKTTVGEILSKKYNLKKVSIGQILKEMAQAQGMTVAEFNTYMETHPEYDNLVDDKLKSYENISGNFLFDSRMAWHFVPSGYSVYMKVDVETAALRIMNAHRENEQYPDVSVAVDKLTKRRQSELLRYNSLYGVDISDMSNYDLVVDTSGKSPEEVASIIIENFEIWLNN
ncbi:MAG: cytidylate kinase family protein [Clostridia bacterium]|nr:cytidylate kinase family protein [Clostridia bacterium]